MGCSFRWRRDHGPTRRYEDGTGEWVSDVFVKFPELLENLDKKKEED